MKTVIVTGAAGFIGYRLAQTLQNQGFSVICVDQLSHFESRAEHHLSPLSPSTQKIDRDSLMQWLKANGASVSAIFHMGACSNTTMYDVEFLTRVNVEYSQNLWNECTRLKIPFIYASSAATYGDGAMGFNDDEAWLTRLKPLNPYGQSKHTFDLWVMGQEKLGNHPPVWSGFKFFNVYGFGERHKGSQASMVMHGFDQITRTGKIRLFKSYNPAYEDGMQLRDFVFIEDICRALLFALEKPISRGIYNLGSGRASSFLDLARATFKALVKPENIEFFEMPPEMRDKYQYFTEAKMTRLKAQGFPPASTYMTPLKDGVAKYVSELTEACRSGSN